MKIYLTFVLFILRLKLQATSLIIFRKPCTSKFNVIKFLLMPLLFIEFKKNHNYVLNILPE